MKGKIAEIFESVQGEGIFFGEKQLFVRFFGCNLKCSFCDTKLSSYSEYEPHELAEELKLFYGDYHSVSFTGGEPLLQKDFLKEVLFYTSCYGFKNYLETNGTLADELAQVIDYVDIVAMDLKLPTSAGIERHFWDIHRDFLHVASKKEVFVKSVVCKSTHEDDLNQALELINKVNPTAVLVLQPNSFEHDDDLSAKLERFKEMGIEKNIATCVIPQMHKMLELR